MCEDHKGDGWILKDVVISDNMEWSNDNIEAIGLCNHLGCTKTTKFKFSVEDIREV